MTHTLHRLLPLGALLACACTAEPARDAPARAPSVSAQSAEERITRWTRERPGQPIQASIAFPQLQSDSAVRALLERYNVRPYLAHAWAGGAGVYAQLPPEQANVSVIADARAQLTQRLERNVCNVAQRVRSMLDDQRATRVDSARERNERGMLARLRAEDEALVHVRNGGAIIWAVYVIGAPDAVRRLGADALVWGFEPIEITTEEGQTLSGVPRPPEPPPVGEIPTYHDIAALSDADVTARLQQIAARPARDCPTAEAATQTIDGNWVVAARHDGRAILIAQPQTRSGVRGTREPGTLEVMRYAPGEPLQPAQLQLLPLTLPGVPPEQARALAIGRAQLGGRDVFVNVPGHGPALLTSPADPNTHVFAEANALWQLSSAGDVRRLTAQRTGAFDYSSLVQRQREGEVILYWAAAPVWSVDGRFIAYATNREAVHQNTRGQSVWLLNVATGSERALLHEAGESFHPEAWLGNELVYGGPPGVGAIDVASGTRRRLTSGTFVTASPDGTTLVTADDVPHATRLQLLTRSGARPLTAPAPGATYAPQAVFSPNGQRLLLQSVGGGGDERRFHVYHRDADVLTEVEATGHKITDWPQWLNDGQLLINVLDRAAQTARAVIVDVTLQ